MTNKINPKGNSFPDATAIVLAAGRGERMSRGKISKQYLPLEKKPILVHTLLVFEKCPSITEIILVVGKDEINYCQDAIVKKFNLRKVNKIIIGGERRQDSAYNALEELSETSRIVLVHDSVRPFITDDMIQRIVEEVQIHKAVVPAVPLTNTVKEGDGRGFVKKTLDRSCLLSIQTPQGFESGLIQKAYASALKENFYGTDDASLVERIGHPVKVVEGSHENIKITTPEDLIIAEAIMRKGGKTSF